VSLLPEEVVGIVPAAGRGSRMEPLTRFIPKEMLPFGRHPLVEHAVAELAAAGVREICVVLGEGKECIGEYLRLRHRAYLPSSLRFAFQEEPRGLGDALLCAAPVIGERPFLMALPDQFIVAAERAAVQLLRAAGGGGQLWSTMVRIPDGEGRLFPGARTLLHHRDPTGRIIVDGLSAAEDSPVRGFGRTIFPPGSLRFMSEGYRNPQSGEVDLLLSFRSLLEHFDAYAALLEGDPCDFGTWEGYCLYQGRHGCTKDSDLPRGRVGPS